MLLTGRRVSAKEGQRLGFVNEVTDPGTVLERALDEAREIASVSPSSIRAALRVLRHMDDMENLRTNLLYSRQVLMDLRETEDFSAGVNAFVEKRAPEWKNR